MISTPTTSPSPWRPPSMAGTEVVTHDLFTNGIVYLDVAMNLHALPSELHALCGAVRAGAGQDGHADRGLRPVVAAHRQPDRRHLADDVHCAGARPRRDGRLADAARQVHAGPRPGAARHPARHLDDRQARRPRPLPADCAGGQGRAGERPDPVRARADQHAAAGPLQ